jgi:outer membrane immunogenic protein
MAFRPTAAVLGLFAALSAVSLDAQAADIAKPVVLPTPVNPFEGFYIGGHMGYGWADRSGCVEIFSDFADDCDDDSFDYDQNGGLLGAQIGYNHAFGAWGGHNWIIGAEVSADLSGMTGGLSLDEEEYSGTGDWSWLALGLVKLGLTWNNWMIYGDLGYGLGGFGYNSTACNFDSNHQGWAGGLGLAWASSVNNNWFIDWQHIDFEDKNAHCGDRIFFETAVNTDPDVDILRIGFNHHFR